MPASSPPPLNALRAFEVFARHGSMTRAAGELCVTHGAVSRQIAVLQATLGVELVIGPRHALVLTEAGAELAKSLTTAFSLIGGAVAKARDPQVREIEIFCLGTFALEWLMARLPSFIETHPDVRVRLSESYEAVDYRRDRFDGAIRILEPGQATPGARVTRFLDHFQGPVSAPELMEQATGLDALFKLPRLRSATFRHAWASWAQIKGVELPAPSVEREFAHNHALVEAAASGLGVAVAPWAFVAPDVQAGRLSAPFGFIERPSFFAFLEDERKSDPAVQAFRGWLVDQGARSAPAPIPSKDPVG
ncbi:hypothetical protein LTR94_025203 [Friedmanniomyces endolithicus]|nr:hypothetical protein LTR94_025203 [Friedmanniomyces endolithicus]